MIKMQRIVLKMDMSESEKMRKKAMRITSGAPGVRSVSIQGQNDQLVLLGEGIDLAELTRVLKKKVCQTSIAAVQPAPPQPNPMGQQHNDMMSPARRCTCEIPNAGFCGFCRSMMSQYSCYNQMVPPMYPSPVIYGSYRDDGCRIM